MNTESRCASPGVEFGLSRMLAHALPAWFLRPAVCLFLLRRLHPSQVETSTPVVWAQRVSSQLIDLFDPQGRGALNAGNRQAVSLYESSVAYGFYGIHGGPDLERALTPVAGSRWRAAQLARVRTIGLQHGAYVRNLGCEPSPMAVDDDWWRLQEDE